MRFAETSLKDAYLIELEPKKDVRGHFCRLFCCDALKAQGMSDARFVQVNLSENTNKGTLRGLHFQAAPYSEAKIVYCLQGSIYDVIIDLRQNSSTYLNHFCVTLTSGESRALYIPKGFAHGFLTLEDHVQLLYLMSEGYKSGFERGFCYNDPTFKINWPFEPLLISEKDKTLPAFEPAYALQ